MHSNNSWARGFMALFAIVLAMALALAPARRQRRPSSMSRMTATTLFR